MEKIIAKRKDIKNDMNREDFFDKILGGVFALVAIIAATFELVLGGISAASIAACIKDIFGTLAVVILFFAVIRDKIPKYSFEKRLQKAIEFWQQENSNMIIRKPEHDIEHIGMDATCYSLDLKTSVIDFYEPKSNTNKTGLFLRMPALKRENYNVDKIELNFYLNKGTFFSSISSEIDLRRGYEQLIKLFSDLVNNKHSGFAIAGGSGKEFKVQIQHAIKTNEDIKNLVDVINTVYTAYLVSANVEIIK